MKLLMCLECGDIFNLTSHDKSCSCGHASGRYVDQTNAFVTGGVVIGFDNAEFLLALAQQPEFGAGAEFTAFVLPKFSETVTYW